MNKYIISIISSIVLFVGCILFLYLTGDEGNEFSKVVSFNDEYYVGEIEEINVEENTEEITEEVTNEEDVIDNGEENEEVEESSLIVYDNMTLDELANKLDRTLKNELHGKGYLYASYSLEKGVDPYLAVAISMEETGCNWNCSNLVKSCNNVGGMKGSGCGSYGYFDTLDNGIKAFIDNIERNYVAYGLTTAEAMNPKYAENPLWARNVNNYITRIKNN